MNDSSSIACSSHKLEVGILLAVNCVSAIATSLLNTLVIMAIWKTPALHTPSRYLLASLSILDLFNGCVVQPGFIGYLALLFADWCDTKYALLVTLHRLAYFCGAMSLYVMALMALDRLLVVKLLVAYRVVVTTRRVLIAVSGAVVIKAVIYSLIPAHFEILKLVGYIFSVLYLSAIIVFYAMAIVYLRRHSSLVSPTASDDQPAGDEVFSVCKYRKSFVTMVIVLASSLVAYVPVLCFFAVVRDLSLTRVLDVVRMLFVEILTALLTSLVNPIIYLWRMRDLRGATKSIIWCRD
ncbi:predicted protein [Nematostella vectensis]|uniref:G-protein coupled receptors family 1 profile domain-containing protein n=1 Tax=Nematostella vectensis TaxID=45351 RepID=A7RPL7_NEMVE|nr:predicted protein [Nematostella vectensis]|eukprot:XP_001638594.1 predicted protein [Nematostella vectensis]